MLNRLILALLLLLALAMFATAAHAEPFVPSDLVAPETASLILGGGVLILIGWKLRSRNRG